jgi:dephospho-CoA kinase
MKLPEIIGVAGSNGAGKDKLADVRLERQHARKVSLSDILRTEATKQGLDHSRENLSSISTRWGRKFGAGALSLMTLKNFAETRTDNETGISIVSIRRPAEAVTIQEHGGIVLWIDADREIRYQRILEAQRDRIDDMVTYEEFSQHQMILQSLIWPVSETSPTYISSMNSRVPKRIVRF